MVKQEFVGAAPVAVKQEFVGAAPVAVKQEFVAWIANVIHGHRVLM